VKSSEPEADSAAAIRAAVDVLFYAPLGFGALIVEDSPAAVRRVRQELSNARFIGKLAVDQGISQLRGRVDEARQPTPAREIVASSDVPEVRSVSESASAMRNELSTDVDPGGSEAEAMVPAADELALPDYDTLPAIDIVAKLDSLGPEDRDDVARYESANRRRRTVLGKIAQLSSS
jgi:hypothetical protein